MENEKEKLKREITEAKNRLKVLEKQEKETKKDLAIKKLKEFTDQEKIKFFNNMYNTAKNELEDHEKGDNDEDNDHYAWEEYIVILARDKEPFWEYWNSFYK